MGTFESVVGDELVERLLEVCGAEQDQAFEALALDRMRPTTA
jgi:hypothetical protein